MALNIAVPLSGVGGLAPISPIGVDCWENIKILVSPMGSESSGVSSLDSEEAKIQHLKPTPLTPAKKKPEIEMPNRELKIMYNVRDLLDLYKNVRTDEKSFWDFQYAKLPEHNMAMYLANRSQYHRLGAHGLTPEYRLLKCQCCDFQYPINRAGTDFTQTSLVTSSTTSAMTFSTANNNCGVGFKLSKNNKIFRFNNNNNANNEDNNNISIGGRNNDYNYSNANRNSDTNFDGFFNKTINNTTPPTTTTTTTTTTTNNNNNRRLPYILNNCYIDEAEQMLAKSMSQINANLNEILNISSTDTSDTPSPLTLNSFNNSPILNSHSNHIINNHIQNSHSNGSNYVPQNTYANNNIANNQILNNNNNNNINNGNNNINGSNNNTYNLTRNTNNNNNNANNTNNFYSMLNNYNKDFAINAASNNTILNNTNTNNTINNINGNTNINHNNHNNQNNNTNNNINHNSYFNNHSNMNGNGNGIGGGIGGNMNLNNTPNTPTTPNNICGGGNIGGHFYNNSSASTAITNNHNATNNSFNSYGGQHYASMYKYF